MKRKKLSISLVSFIVFAMYVIFHLYVCPYEKYYESGYRGCDLLIYQDVFLEPIATFCLALFTISIFTFFVSEKIFKKWFIFTVFWIIITTSFVFLAPVSAGGPFGIGPDKELVSIWMSGFFVIISILMFIIMSLRNRKHVCVKK